MLPFNISVVIAVKDAERYIEKCVESVLSQTLKPFEVIVIDDGSVDGTYKKLKKFERNINFISRPNKGVSASLNEGINISSGNYLSFLDADDYWAHDKLEIQYKAFTQNDDLDAVFGLSKPFYDGSLFIENNAPALPSYFKGTMLVLKPFFMEVGLFDEQTKSGEFIDWFSRAQQKNIRHEMCNSVVHYRRLRKNSLSAQKSYTSELLNVMRAHIKRNQSHTV